MNKTIELEKRPIGKPQLTDFKFVEGVMPNIGKDEILLKTVFVSVDPYLRGRMSEAKSYAASFQLHEPIKSGIVAEVIASNLPSFVKGDFVSGLLD